MSQSPKIALFLAGGGARAAYQIGVLQAIFSLLSETGWPATELPFKIICGTSAGALNAAALASRADNFEESITVLLRIWRELDVEQVYRADSIGVIRSGRAGYPCCLLAGCYGNGALSRRILCWTIRRWSVCFIAC